MAREISFPRARHVALSASGHSEGQAKAEGAEAVLWPIAAAEEEALRSPAVGIPLSQPVQPGAPGVPEPGALPEAPAPRLLPRVVWVDVSLPSSQAGYRHSRSKGV